MGENLFFEIGNVFEEKHSGGKIFVWEKTSTEKYLCIPIEEAEYDYNHNDYVEGSEDLESLPAAIWNPIQVFMKRINFLYSRILKLIKK